VKAKDLNDEISGAYKEGVFNKARIYASFKIKGPAFYSGDKRPNRVFCDRVWSSATVKNKKKERVS
jgi:hypothetical protein